MAKTCWRVKQRAVPKFPTRAYNRCQLCGRSHAYHRKFKICRICLRDLASRGEIPGMRKASW